VKRGKNTCLSLHEHKDRGEEIAAIPKEERPRERLCARGAEQLSDQELLAVMIGSGVRGSRVQSISVELLRLLDGRAEAGFGNSPRSGA
jgi:hypothetical protein